MRPSLGRVQDEQGDDESSSLLKKEVQRFCIQLKETKEYLSYKVVLRGKNTGEDMSDEVGGGKK